MSSPMDDSPTVDLSPDLAPADASRAVEVKLIVMGVLAPILYAILAAIQANTTVLAGLPAWAQFVILAALPPALAFLAGYRTPSNRI